MLAIVTTNEYAYILVCIYYLPHLYFNLFLYFFIVLLFCVVVCRFSLRINFRFTPFLQLFFIRTFRFSFVSPLFFSLVQFCLHGGFRDRISHIRKVKSHLLRTQNYQIGILCLEACVGVSIWESRHYAHISACFDLRFHTQPHSDSRKVSAPFPTHSFFPN